MSRGLHSLGPALLWAGAVVVLGSLLAVEPGPNRILGLYSNLRFLALLAGAYAVAWGLYLWRGRGPMRAKLGRLALFSASLALPLAVVEATAALGLVDYSRILPGGGRIPLGGAGLNPRWWRLDPELIHIRYPHQKISGETTGDIYSVPEPDKRLYTVEAEYDVNGFRNSMDATRAAVVLVGDSFLEAGLVQEPATAAALLRRELGTEVVNLGMTMYGPPQELAALRRYGLPLQPRVVLWFLFEGNDLDDSVRYEEIRRDVERRFAEYDGYARTSLLRNLGHLLAEWTGPRPPRRRSAASCDVDAGAGAERIYFRYDGSPLRWTSADALDKTLAIVESAHAMTTVDGARFVLVYVPTKFRVYRERCREGAEETLPPDWGIDEFPEKVGAWSRERGIPFLDLTPVLRAHAATDGLLYYPDDSHWSPLGHGRVSETIGEFLTATGWLD